MSNFKVGDWIKIGDTVQQITAINPENDYNITCDMIETTDDYVSVESVEPWKPKDGEWVVCWMDDEIVYTIERFNSMAKYENIAPLEFVSNLKDKQ